MAESQHNVKPGSDNKIQYEFGGPVGTSIMIIFFHFLVYYFYVSAFYYKGLLFYPSSFSDIIPFFGRMWQHIAEGASPTVYGFAIYIGFFLIELFLAKWIPGFMVKGLPVPSEGNKQRDYLCNGASCWYVTLILAFILHFSGIFRLTELIDNFGHIVTAAIIFIDILALYLYVFPILQHKQYKITRNPIYDYFMGSTLNPSIFKVDLKFFFDIRYSALMFLFTLAAALKQQEITGSISWPMIFLVVASALYANASHKGEEALPQTFDILHEKCGWMLLFMNGISAQVFYSLSSIYILQNNPQYPFVYTILLFVLLLTSYYAWDTSNTQKCRFRMQLAGTYIARKAFPQLPWGTLKNPKYLKTTNGGTLLIDGWWELYKKTPLCC